RPGNWMPCGATACRTSRRRRSCSCATGWWPASWTATPTARPSTPCWPRWRPTGASGDCWTASIGAGCCWVTETDVERLAPLPRAAEPVLNFDGMKRPLTGPGKLCAGLDITRADNGRDLVAGGDFFLADDGSRPPKRARSPRVGVDYAGDWAQRLLRFYVPGN